MNTEIKGGHRPHPVGVNYGTPPNQGSGGHRTDADLAAVARAYGHIEEAEALSRRAALGRAVTEDELRVGDEVIVSYRGVVVDDLGARRVQLSPGAFVDLNGWPSEIRRL